LPLGWLALSLLSGDRGDSCLSQQQLYAWDCLSVQLGAALSPAFAADTLEYSLNVESDISTVGAAVPKASCQLQINKKASAGVTTNIDLAVGFSESAVKALTKAGGTPRCTRYPDDAYFYPSAHASWIPAYASAELSEWLFQQAR